MGVDVVGLGCETSDKDRFGVTWGSGDETTLTSWQRHPMYSAVRHICTIDWIERLRQTKKKPNNLASLIHILFCSQGLFTQHVEDYHAVSLQRSHMIYISGECCHFKQRGKLRPSTCRSSEMIRAIGWRHSTSSLIVVSTGLWTLESWCTRWCE